MNPFKEGDVIRRTHNNLPHMQSDSIHTVTRVDNLVVFLEGQVGSFHSSYFQHWTPKEPLREPHPHADVICHHVNGGDIEYLDVHEIWMPVLHWATRVNSGLGERFMTSTKYRIKPELTEREVEIVRIEEAITKLSDDLYSLKMGG